MVTCLFLGFSPFSASRYEVFFSLEGVARRAVRFVLVSDRWESWLSQVADNRTKQPMRQHPHLSKLFFLIMPLFQRSRCKDTNFIFGTVRICPQMSANVRKCPLFFSFTIVYVKKNQ
jgi:hypothetical protein